MSILFPHLLLDGPRPAAGALHARAATRSGPIPTATRGCARCATSRCVGLHAAMTPTWSETAWWADYVLPMGHGPERHDTHSYETHAGRWLGFRQPVRRVAMEKLGQPVEFTYEANPGEVWEEGEFWIEVSWRADPDGSLGIRQYYESPYRPGEKIRLEEYYRWMFENSVPGLPEKAAAEGPDAAGVHAPLRRVRARGRRLRPARGRGRRSRGHRGARRRGDRHQALLRSAATCRSPAGRTPSPRRSTAWRAAASTRPRASSSSSSPSSSTGAGPSTPCRPTRAATCTTR